jgi:hypothetical protein
VSDNVEIPEWTRKVNREKESADAAKEQAAQEADRRALMIKQGAPDCWRRFAEAIESNAAALRSVKAAKIIPGMEMPDFQSQDQYCRVIVRINPILAQTTLYYSPSSAGIRYEATKGPCRDHSEGQYKIVLLPDDVLGLEKDSHGKKSTVEQMAESLVRDLYESLTL